MVTNGNAINQCVCDNTHCFAEEYGECLTIATAFGDNCLDDCQCKLFNMQSTCSSTTIGVVGTCGCMTGTCLNGNECLTYGEIGDACTNDCQCEQDVAALSTRECRNGYCLCEVDLCYNSNTGNCDATVAGDVCPTSPCDCPTGLTCTADTIGADSGVSVCCTTNPVQVYDGNNCISM